MNIFCIFWLEKNKLKRRIFFFHELFISCRIVYFHWFFNSLLNNFVVTFMFVTIINMTTISIIHHIDYDLFSPFPFISLFLFFWFSVISYFHFHLSVYICLLHIILNLYVTPSFCHSYPLIFLNFPIFYNFIFSSFFLFFCVYLYFIFLACIIDSSFHLSLFFSTCLHFIFCFF